MCQELVFAEHLPQRRWPVHTLLLSATRLQSQVFDALKQVKAMMPAATERQPNSKSWSVDDRLLKQAC